MAVAVETKQQKSIRLARSGRVRCISSSTDTHEETVLLFEVVGDSTPNPYRVSLTPLGQHCNCEGGRHAAADSRCSHPGAAEAYMVLVDEGEVKPSAGCIWEHDSAERVKGSQPGEPETDVDARYGVPFRLGLPDGRAMSVTVRREDSSGSGPWLEWSWGG